MKQMMEESFGEMLRSFRKRRRLSQQTLANLLGVHRNTMSIWERGDFLPESKTMVLEVARQLYLTDQETRLLLEASLTALSSYWHVPFPRNPFFTGRAEILRTLQQGLSAQQAGVLTQSYALCGLGGIGKTHVAIEYAYRHALEYSAVFWIEAENVERIIASFLAIAEQLHQSVNAQTDPQQLVKAVLHWLSTHQSWLLIWDNLEELDLLQHYLPANPAGALLITTRQQALGTRAMSIEVPPLNEEESIAMLLRRAKRQPGLSLESSAREKAAELVQQLEGLPLALDQAGAYIEETGCSPADYLQRYREYRPQILARRGTDASAHPTSVAVTLQLAIEQVGRHHPAAADLMRVCAFLHPEAIPEELFVAGAPHLGATLGAVVTDPYLCDLMLGALRSSSLVTRYTETRTLSVHRLVQAVLQDLMEPNEVSHWSMCALRVVNAAFPNVEFVNWQACERSLPHAQVCLLHSLQSGLPIPEAGRLFYVAGSYLLERGRYAEAGRFLKQALLIREQQQEYNPIAVADCLKCLGTLLWRQGNYEASQDPLQQALVLYKRHLEPGHLTIAASMNDLALLYLDHGKYDQAEALYQSIRTSFPWEILGPNTLDNVARLFYTQGKYEQAELWYQRALQNWERQPGHPDRAFSLNNLAMLYLKQGRYEQAEPLLQRSLSIRQQVFGPDHPRTGAGLYGLAKLFLKQGKYEQAAPLAQHALLIDEQQLGKTHRSTAMRLVTVAAIAEQQGNDKQAEEGYQRALAMLEQSLGPNHEATAQCITALATLYRKQGKSGQAKQLYQRALRIVESLFNSHHPEVAPPLHGLATLAQQHGQYEQAEALYQRVLTIHQEHLESEHPDVAETLHDLASLFHQQSHATEALPRYQQALAIRERAFGGSHPATEETRHCLEQLLQEMKQAEETTARETATPESEQFSSCACGCDRLIERGKSRGEPRRFFSQACRQRFYRHALQQKRHANSQSVVF